jgi:glycerophosphoryl diester phosphodiesterase
VTVTETMTSPAVIAHRGASAHAPENTIAAFELAIEQGADGIELDVHLSRDDQPVVIHDFTLDRTTDGSGAVRDRSVRELKRLDAGSWRAVPFRGQRIQTLQEVFERFRNRTRFWVELKGGSELYPGIEERLVSTIEVYEVLDRVLLQSFDHGALARISTLNPEVRLGALIARPPIEPLIRSPGAAHAICPSVDLVSAETVVEIRAATLDCHVWTVDEPAQMDRLVEWGVSGIITDRPDLLCARLGRQRPRR